jgi:hypothetical protein
MRDKRFVAVHRGGTLTKEDHQKLIRWARACSEHVLPLMDNIDSRLTQALYVSEEWENSRMKTGEAMKASRRVHAAAREFSDPVFISVVRSVGHAVATAHMADHSPGAALYALKALKHAGRSIDAEKEWQMMQLQQLPQNIAEIVLDSMQEKGRALKII